MSNTGTIEAKPLSEHARCKHCAHAAYAHIMVRDRDGIDGVGRVPGAGDCFCGCIHFEQRVKDPNAGRDWVVQVGFFQKNRWVEGEARVKAQGQIGAIAKGVREVKKDKIKKGSRVAQIKVILIPVPGKKKGS